MVYYMGRRLWCLRGTVLLQFKDMNRLSVAGGTQELGICTEGQWTDADVSDTQITDGQGWNCCDKYDDAFKKNKQEKHLNDTQNKKRCFEHLTNLFIPLRNSNSFCPSGTLKTLITVPWWGNGCQGIICLYIFFLTI